MLIIITNCFCLMPHLHLCSFWGEAKPLGPTCLSWCSLPVWPRASPEQPQPACFHIFVAYSMHAGGGAFYTVPGSDKDTVEIKYTLTALHNSRHSVHSCVLPWHIKMLIWMTACLAGITAYNTLSFESSSTTLLDTTVFWLFFPPP